MTSVISNAISNKVLLLAYTLDDITLANQIVFLQIKCLFRVCQGNKQLTRKHTVSP